MARALPVPLDRRRAAAVLSTGLLLGLLLPFAGPGGVARAAASWDLEAAYDVSVGLDWDSRRVRVRTTIELRNTSGGAVDRLHLNTVALKHGNLKRLRVKVDGAAVDAAKGGQTLTVPLGRTLEPGATASLLVAYRARLSTRSGGRAFLFSQLDGVAQMYRFIPWLSRRIPFTDQDHGEPFLTPVSPRVQVRVSADRPLVWATSGRRTGKLDERTFEFVATDVRDFNLAASPAWKTVRGRSADGETRIYAHVRGHDGRRLIRLAREALARYEAITHVPYPHDTYRIAETGGGLAMESPALVWIPSSRTAADLPYLVSHETAHQWWYSLVGNDQATSAFADEALSEYYARKKHLSMRRSRCRTDRLDRTIKAYTSACYYEVIYVQGARFLDSLRRDFGGAAFRGAVRAYTRDHRFGVASNIRLLEAFRAQMGDAVLSRFEKRFPGLY